MPLSVDANTFLYAKTSVAVSCGCNTYGVIHAPELASLLNCPLDTPVRVTRVVDQDRDFLRFIAEHHLKPGESIRVEYRDDSADCVRLRGRDDQRITIGMRAASKLLVEVQRT